MKESLLSLEDVGVEVAGVSLLRGVSLSVDQGEITGLYGPSGCGKSSLLRCVAGLSDPSAGKVRFEGKYDDWPSYRRQVVLVAQQPALLDATVEENLARVFSYRSAGRPFPHDEAKDLLEKLDIGAQRLSQPARSLSVGQQRRVCLIRALLIRPSVLLLDEPASALDEDAVGLLEAVLRDAIDNAVCGAILLVTHDQDQIQRLCHKSLDLSPHRVAAKATL